MNPESTSGWNRNMADAPQTEWLLIAWVNSGGCVVAGVAIWMTNGWWDGSRCIDHGMVIAWANIYTNELQAEADNG